MITQAPIQNIVDVWRDVERLIKLSNAHSMGESDHYDTLADLVRGQKQLWIVYDDDQYTKAVATTEINQWPKARKLRIVHLAGEDMDQWFDELINTLEYFARQNVCTHIEAYGRRGWVKQSKHLGFKESYTIVSKEI